MMMIAAPKRRSTAIFAAVILTAFAGVATWDVYTKRSHLMPPKATPAAAPIPADSPDSLVYLTTTGRKYHRADCQYLKLSSREMRLSVAKEAGFEPCLKCQPSK